MYNYNNFPFKLSGKTVDYICQRCKYQSKAPIETILEIEEDEWNNLPFSTPPYIICSKYRLDRCVSIDINLREDIIKFTRKINIL